MPSTSLEAGIETLRPILQGCPLIDFDAGGRLLILEALAPATGTPAGTITTI